MRILLQFPEGLKQKAMEHAYALEREGNEVFISASPTFGACDLALGEARSLKVDKLVHFGHGEFHKVNAEFEIEYVEYRIDAPLSLLMESLGYISDFKTIGIVTTIQHAHQLDEIRKFYEDNGKDVVIGKPYGFAKLPGQILGCDVGSAATVDRIVDAHIYFGGGIFHPLGALLATKKPFLAIEPFAGTVGFIDHMRIEHSRKSRGRILASLSAERFGILVSTKNGQHNLALGKLLKRRIESLGMSAQILVSDTFDFESISNMLEFDAFVNTACPRIAVDDTGRLPKPLLSANELNEALKMREELRAIRAAKG